MLVPEEWKYHAVPAGSLLVAPVMHQRAQGPDAQFVGAAAAKAPQREERVRASVGSERMPVMPIEREHDEMIAAPVHRKNVIVSIPGIELRQRPEHVVLTIGPAQGIDRKERPHGAMVVGELEDRPQNGEGRLAIIEQRPGIDALRSRSSPLAVL